MEGQVYNFVVDWSITLASLLYCHSVGKLIPPGKTRFLAILPVLCLFFYLPLNLTTMVFCGVTFFFISWLGSFKLILFAFDQGPLSSHPPLPLSHFILTACLPIKIIRSQQNPSHQTHPKSPKDYATRFLLFLIAIKIFGYKDHLHPLLATILYAYLLYFTLDYVLLKITAVLVRTVAGVELEPQFDDPHHATSVQNFWGKRWNLMVSGILRSTVYLPARAIFSRFVPAKWVSVPAVFATFLVSGILHEMIFYYLGRLRPDWVVTWFFVVQGVWVGAEIVIKKTMVHRFELPVSLARTLTLTFVILTCYWLFFPPLLRFDIYVRGCREVMSFVEFIKHGHLLNPDECPCPYV